jgi:hypothetical protein
MEAILLRCATAFYPEAALVSMSIQKAKNGAHVRLRRPGSARIVIDNTLTCFDRDIVAEIVGCLKNHPGRFHPDIVGTYPARRDTERLISRILRGRFQAVSVEKLPRMLTAFDQDVGITVEKSVAKLAGLRLFRQPSCVNKGGYHES